MPKIKVTELPTGAVKSSIIMERDFRTLVVMLCDLLGVDMKTLFKMAVESMFEDLWEYAKKEGLDDVLDRLKEIKKAVEMAKRGEEVEKTKVIVNINDFMNWKRKRSR